MFNVLQGHVLDKQCCRDNLYLEFFWILDRFSFNNYFTNLYFFGEYLHDKNYDFQNEFFVGKQILNFKTVMHCARL